jgi:integrase
LKAIRQTWIDSGRYSRGTINANVRRVVRIFRWAASEEMIPASIAQALGTVPGLLAGRCEAREPDDVKPVPLEVVEATLPFLSKTVADMVRIQLLCGARPQEVCKLRPGDVDRTEDVWQYTVPSHKTEHRGRKRVVFIGPACQEILSRYLLRGDDDHCFVPAEVVRSQLADKHTNRTTPLSCGNKPGSNRSRSPKRKPGAAYDHIQTAPPSGRTLAS